MGGTRAMALSDCARVLPGFSVAGRIEHDPDGTHQLILTKHLVDGVPYRYQKADELRIAPRARAEEYLVIPGDVLFMSRGTRNRAWVIAAVQPLTIAPVSFYRLRPGPMIDAEYLAWFLNQPAAQTAIGQVRTGAGTPLVQRQGFEQIEVLVPPLDRQRAIAALGRSLAEERLLRQRLADATERLHQALGQAIIQDLRQPAPGALEARP